MAATIFNSTQKIPQGAAGLIVFNPGVVEAQVVTASKNGGAPGAVNAGTTAAQIGTSPFFALTVNAADTATLGAVLFICTGATDTNYVLVEVILAGVAVASMAPNSIAPGVMADNAIDAGTFSEAALTALEAAMETGPSEEEAAFLAGIVH